MSEHPIQGLMNTALQNIRDMIDVNTIIGEEIVASDGTVIIPVSKVSLGFASGGSDIPNKLEKDIFGGGSGAGVSINPVAFIVVSNGEVKLRLNLRGKFRTGGQLKRIIQTTDL
ncbi:MAG TPA: GerW family sporulation protein [Clostridia bacterium]|nr:GerW family sporulation protein [Clostridia bacterium]